MTVSAEPPEDPPPRDNTKHRFSTKRRKKFNQPGGATINIEPKGKDQ